jgi:cyclophilin family peptidyl-prolyl cis-trans isomerase
MVMGSNQIDSIFMILFRAQHQLDGHQMVIGRAISGWEAINLIESAGSKLGKT